MGVITQWGGRMFKVVTFGGFWVLMGYIYNTFVPVATLLAIMEKRGVCATIEATRVPHFATTSVVVGLGQLMLNGGACDVGTQVYTI